MVGAFLPDGSFSVTHALALVVLVFSLLLADFFDTMGTMVAVGSEGGLNDDNGMPPRTTETSSNSSTLVMMRASLFARRRSCGAPRSSHEMVAFRPGRGPGRESVVRTRIPTGALTYTIKYDSTSRRSCATIAMTR